MNTLKARFRVANASEAAESILARGKDQDLVDAHNNLNDQIEELKTQKRG